MCLIVFKNDPAQHFSNKNFKAMIGRNGDGLGIMYREDGRIKVVKSIGTDNEKFALFRAHRDRASWAMHSRMKTHGKIDEKNCHPYKLLDIDDGDPIDLYMMHNGVLSNAPKVDGEYSDTWHYCEYILKPMLKENPSLLWDNDYIQELIQEHIGKNNKFLFMRSDDHEYPVLILNSKSGTERNGMWLSNTYSIDTNNVRSWNGGYHHNSNVYHNNAVHQDYLKRQEEERARAAAKNPAIPTAAQRAETERLRLLNEQRAKDDAADREVLNRVKSGYDTRILSADEQKEFDKLFAEELAKEAEQSTAREGLTQKKESAIIMPLKRGEVIDSPIKGTQLFPKRETTIMMPDGTVLRDNVDDINHQFRMELQILRGQSDYMIESHLKQEPEAIADMILALYDKCTMDFNTIVKQCKKSPDNIVRLIRNMTLKDNYTNKMLA